MEGRLGPELIRPLLVAKYPEPARVCNDVYITPHTTLGQCPAIGINHRVLRFLSVTVTRSIGSGSVIGRMLHWLRPIQGNAAC